MLKPIDIETKDFKKAAFGYSVDEVDSFLDEVIYDYEKLYDENKKLNSTIESLNETVNYYKSMEETIKNTILSAEKNAEESKKIAEQKADNIIKDAENHAADLVQNTRIEASILRNEIMGLKSRYEGLKGGLRAVLETQLKMLDVHEEQFKNIETVTEEIENKETAATEE